MMKDGSFLFGGGILDGTGKMSGGVLVVDFESRDKVDEWLKNETYILNKVWTRVEVYPFLVPPQFLSLFRKYQTEPSPDRRRNPIGPSRQISPYKG